MTRVFIHHAPLWHALRAASPGGRIVTRCLFAFDYVPVMIATGSMPAELQCPACRRELARDEREAAVDLGGGEAGGA